MTDVAQGTAVTDGRGSRPRVRRAVACAVAAGVVLLWVLGLVLATLDHRVASEVPTLGAVGFGLVGALLLSQRPDNRLGPLLSLGAFLMLVLGVGGDYAHHTLVQDPGSLPAGSFVAWLADGMALPVVGLFAGLVPQLFPTGRTISPRWRLPACAAVGFAVLGAVGNAFSSQDLESVPGMANPYAVPSWAPVLDVMILVCVPLGALALVGSLAALVVRWRRGLGEERQQLRWFLAGALLLPVPLALHDAVPQVANALASVALLAMAVGLGVGVMRYRLYDLDLVVRRAVGYAVVSAVVGGLYLAVVAGVELVAGGGRGAQVLAAITAAAAFHPVRSRVQRTVDELFYGDRARPYEAVSRLGLSLEAALPPDEVLPAVASTVAASLRLPYVSLELADGDGWRMAAEVGAATGRPVPFDMTYQGATVGRMLVCPRAKEDHLSPDDTRLLTDLARQAGVAAQAVSTDAALRRSRAELVAAREEERRRIRRDLHDGLGPTLAGVSLGLQAARVQLGRDEAAAERQLEVLEQQIEDAVLDVRRLVYDLRPPALDEFGLVRAVEMHAARLEGGALGLVVEAPPEGLGRLPAAVEVAAYRIATEALTNVTRHARAAHGVVRFWLNGGLEVQIDDDGCGIAPGQPAGVGLTAMRERAAELGGRLTVSVTPQGTRVSAHLPVQP